MILHSSALGETLIVEVERCTDSRVLLIPLNGDNVTRMWYSFGKMRCFTENVYGNCRVIVAPRYKT